MNFANATTLCRLMRLVSLALLAAASLTHSGFAQADATSSSPALSRFDLYAGYGYFYPFKGQIAGNDYPPVALGSVGSVAGYFGRRYGLQAEGSAGPEGDNDANCVYTAQVGPIARLQRGRFVPFVHALGGGAVVGGPLSQPCSTWGWGVTGGGGLDVVLPFFHDRFALRAFQADFMYSHIDNGPVTPGGGGGLGEIYAVRGSAGLVFRFGSLVPRSEVPTFNCSAEPSSGFAGDPITLTASTMNLTGKQKPKYLWTSTSGNVVGDGSTATIDSTSLQPGSYQVVGKLVAGDRQRLVASCTASFSLQTAGPPTVACAADKAAINSGVPVQITATASSPQNRPLTYTYSTTAGIVAGNGATAALSTAGASPGSITVTCKVTDDKGRTASANTSIVVATPAPLAPAVVRAATQARNLCTITFDRDRKRPTRVDNESKACLDDIALTLNRETGDKLVMVGNHAEKETNRESALRAMNAAEFLTREKGIDPARLDLRVGSDGTHSVAMLLVPPGASIDAGSSFDTTSVKRIGQAYGTGRSRTARTTTPARRRITQRRARTARLAPAARRHRKVRRHKR